MAGQENKYDQRYTESDCYWGTKPSVLCDRLLKVLAGLELKPSDLSMIDLGCGEGRNTIYMARRGITVTGLDLSPAGLQKTKLFAERAGVEIKTIEASLFDCVFERDYDIVFSTGTVHYIPEDSRERCFEYFKSKTARHGFHAISTLVEKPFIEKAPDSEEQVTLFESGELMSYYKDWEIIYTIETIFDCNSGGVPHRHAVNRLIARKP